MMIKLIPEAAISWRFTSVQATLLLGLVSSIQTELFPVLEPLFTPEQWRYVLPAWAVLIFVLRNIAQPGLEPERELRALDKAEQAALPTDQVETWAMYLYAASQPSKPWEQVSEESKAKWRQVASAARGYAVDSLEAP